MILKPEPRDASGGGPELSGLVANELLGLTLARACGLRAAGAAARKVAGRACLVVDRDRDRAASPPTRLHQEDLLMALGRDHRLKYETPSALRTPAAGASPELDTAAAQSVNGVDDPDAITEGDLVAEGAAWGLRREAAAGTVARVLDRLGPGLDRAVRRAAAKGGARPCSTTCAG